MKQVIESNLFILLYVTNRHQHSLFVEFCIRVTGMIGGVEGHQGFGPVIEPVKFLPLGEPSGREQSHPLSLKSFDNIKVC